MIFQILFRYLIQNFLQVKYFSVLPKSPKLEKLLKNLQKRGALFIFIIMQLHHFFWIFLKVIAFNFQRHHGLVKPSKEENHCQESFQKLSLSWKKIAHAFVNYINKHQLLLGRLFSSSTPQILFTQLSFLLLKMLMR